METAELLKPTYSPMHMQDIGSKTWSIIQNELRRECGEETYNSWLSKLELSEFSPYSLGFSVPTRFVKDWILTHFEKKIIRCSKNHMPNLKKISISIATKNRETSDNTNARQQESNHNNITAIVNDLRLTQNSLDKRFSFDTFVVGPSNQFAHAAAKAVAESSTAQPGSNPLFLYGGVGLGKTHLMQAIAWHIFENTPKRKVAYISAEKFMYQFVSALRNKSIMEFKERYRSVDILMVDDIQFICGKESTQEEFFHTLNMLIDNNKQVVISADRSPSDLDDMEDRIKSRLGWGLVADIHNTTYELRLGILQSKIESSNVFVHRTVLEFLASKISSNVRELEGALNKIIAHTRLTGMEINIDNTREILRDLLKANEKIITVEEIQKKVAERYNIKVSDMYSSRRSRIVARPRQIAMYLSKHLTDKSLAEIGKKFGGKDHTTVIHAIKAIDNLVSTHPETAEDVKLLTKVIQC